jgi:nucleotide-binding universal stress UspA family protein
LTFQKLSSPNKFKMQKILIAVDYAKAAQKVAEQGYALAKAMNAEIILLHVVEDVQYYSSSSYDPIMGFGGFVNTDFLSHDAMGSIEKGAANFLKKIKVHLQDDSIQTLVVSGNIADSILETAKKEKCQLIVVGTHSRNGLEELLLGSTAHKLLKHSTLPIYIIPTRNQNT